MPPRFTYWTIILEGKPTAFRARERDDLAPTLRQMQSRHPDARLMWFARGRLWESQEQEREALRRKRDEGRERRGPAWRPGGRHQDPRERFRVPRDEKRRRFADRLRSERQRDEDRPPGAGSGRPQQPPRRRSPRSTDTRPAPAPSKRQFGPRRRPGPGKRGGGRSGGSSR